MENQKIIFIEFNGLNLVSPNAATIDQVEIRIRTAYLLAGGYLRDQNGALMNGAAQIGTTNGALTFIGGQHVQQGQQGTFYEMYYYYFF